MDRTRRYMAFGHDWFFFWVDRPCYFLFRLHSSAPWPELVLFGKKADSGSKLPFGFSYILFLLLPRTQYVVNLT